MCHKMKKRFGKGIPRPEAWILKFQRFLNLTAIKWSEKEDNPKYYRVGTNYRRRKV